MRAVLRKIVNEGLKLEAENVEILRSNLAQARNSLASRLDQEENPFERNRYLNFLDGLLGEFEAQTARQTGLERAYREGIQEAKTLVGESSEIPQNSNFWAWNPGINIGALSAKSSEFVDSIKGVSSQLKESILRSVQQDLALGVSIGDMKRNILGKGLRGQRGRDGAFRSAMIRGEAIARTVTNDLINEGILNTYTQISEQDPSLDLESVWTVVSDRRLSDRCRSLSGQQRTPEDLKSGNLFRSADGWTGPHPPAHVNCRSRLTAQTAPWDTIKESLFPPKEPDPVIRTGEKSPRPLNPRSVGSGFVQTRPVDVFALPPRLVFAGEPRFSAENLNQVFSQLSNPKTRVNLRRLSKWVQDREISLNFFDLSEGLGPKIEGQIQEVLRRIPPDKRSTLRFGVNDATFRRAIEPKKVGGKFAKGYTQKNAKAINVFTRDKQDLDRSINLTDSTLKKRLDLIYGAHRLDTRPERALEKSRAVFNVSSDKLGVDDTTQLFTLIHELGHRIHFEAGTLPPPFKIDRSTSVTRYPIQHAERARANNRSPQFQGMEYAAEHVTLYLLDPDRLAEANPQAFQYAENLVNTVLPSED